MPRGSSRIKTGSHRSTGVFVNFDAVLEDRTILQGTVGRELSSMAKGIYRRGSGVRTDRRSLGLDIAPKSRLDPSNPSKQPLATPDPPVVNSRLNSVRV